ncbi:hypothetical protein FRC12_011598 [Ceratobasidium sp. 428]|nr:hypothetical protein FRC12_011598 [Ceratobasidium sp. 428]
MPFMYHYAGQPGRSTQRSREVISKFYNLTDTGIPGNDDSGAMASFAAFYLVGLYPLPATRQVLVSSPWFPTVNITNSVTGATTTINAVGFKGNPSGSQTGNIFVQNIKVNGKTWGSRCWLDWSVFESGGVVDLYLGTNQGQNCGEGNAALPASLSTGGYN